MQLVPRHLTEPHAISTMRTSCDLQLADLTDNAAIRFGITAEIFTIGDYTLTQQWAHAIAQAEYAGVRYWARHDLAHKHACVAVFSHPDTNTHTARPLTAGPPTPVGDALLRIHFGLPGARGGRRCCSIYWRTIEMGAPPQEAAK